MQSYCSYAGMKEKNTKTKNKILIRKQYDRQIRKQRKEKKKSNATLCPTREIGLKKQTNISVRVSSKKNKTQYAMIDVTNKQIM